MSWDLLGAAWAEQALESVLRLTPALLAVLLGIVAVLLANRLLLGRPKLSHREAGRVTRQLAVVAVAAAAVIGFVLVLPVPDATRAQLLSLLGVVTSAAIALSSTTLVGNAMAGIMLHLVGRFRPGDFIEVDGHMGRVTQRGLLHVEIQTEDRDLETLPNAFLVDRPLKVVEATGTIVSATVSLGYDTPRAQIEELLRAATAEAGLQDGFVQILDLGDFAVTYRAAGFLAEPKTLLSTRSRLRGCMIDALHGAGVEIVSPSFMAQRPLAPDQRVLPGAYRSSEPGPESDVPEEIVFDKAEAAASRDELTAERAGLVARGAEIERELGQAPDEAARGALEVERERLRERVEHIDTVLARDAGS